MLIIFPAKHNYARLGIKICTNWQHHCMCDVCQRSIWDKLFIALSFTTFHLQCHFVKLLFFHVFLIKYEFSHLLFYPVIPNVFFNKCANSHKKYILPLVNLGCYGSAWKQLKKRLDISIGTAKYSFYFSQWLIDAISCKTYLSIKIIVCLYLSMWVLQTCKIS